MIEGISDNLHMITLPMPFRLEHVHVFVLIHDEKLALFDTGLNTPQTFSTLEDALKTIGKSIVDIDQIFITHYHTDHCGMAGRIKEISGATIYMSEISSKIIEIQKDEQLLITRIKNFYTAHGLSGNTVDALITILKSFRKVTTAFQADRAIAPPAKMTIGDTVCEVFSTPGHTRGHVSYFFPEDGILLSGDHVLPDITPNLSPDLACPDFYPLGSFLESLSMIRDIPVSRVYPAHGNPFTNLKERIGEIMEHHRERKTLTLNSVKEGAKTTFQVSLDIFGHDLPEFDRFLAINEAFVHLMELKKEGVIREEKRGECFFYRAT